MIGRLINLPFKVLGTVARAVQERNDAAVREKHGDGIATDDFAYLADEDLPKFDMPEGVDPASLKVKAADVRAWQREGRVMEFVDVRREARFKTGHIRDATHMPLGTIAIRLAELPPDDRVVLYCDKGPDALRAALFLKHRGIEDVVCIAGGLEAWKAAGGEVVRG